MQGPGCCLLSNTSQRPDPVLTQTRQQGCRPHSADGKSEAAKVSEFATWSSRIHTPNQALTTPPSSYQPWREGQGWRGWEVVVAQQPQSHLQAYPVSSPSSPRVHCPRLPIEVPSWVCLPHPQGAQVGGTGKRAERSGGLMEGRGLREESLAVPVGDKAEYLSWALGEGQGSPGQAGPRAPHTEGTGGAEAGPQGRLRELTVWG